MNQNCTTKSINPTMVTTVNSQRVSAHTWTNLSFANNRKPQITIGLPTNFNTPKPIAASVNTKIFETHSACLQPIQSQVLQFISKQGSDTLELNDTLSEEDIVAKESDYLHRKTVKEEHFYEQ